MQNVANSLVQVTFLFLIRATLYSTVYIIVLSSKGGLGSAAKVGRQTTIKWWLVEFVGRYQVVTTWTGDSADR